MATRIMYTAQTIAKDTTFTIKGKKIVNKPQEVTKLEADQLKVNAVRQRIDEGTPIFIPLVTIKEVKSEIPIVSPAKKAAAAKQKGDTT